MRAREERKLTGSIVVNWHRLHKRLSTLTRVKVCKINAFAKRFFIKTKKIIDFTP